MHKKEYSVLFLCDNKCVFDTHPLYQCSIINLVMCRCAYIFSEELVVNFHSAHWLVEADRDDYQ